jgi:hypothetical protein
MMTLRPKTTLLHLIASTALLGLSVMPAWMQDATPLPVAPPPVAAGDTTGIMVIAVAFVVVVVVGGLLTPEFGFRSQDF